MADNRNKGVFVAGTDTGIGKTHVAAILIKTLRSHGLRVAPMKPVASGCSMSSAGPRNDDALCLIEAAGGGFEYSQVNPYALRQPLAPRIAAGLDDVEIGLEPLVGAYAGLAVNADKVVVEGVGGWRMDLAPGLQMADFVRQLDLQVVLVVGMRLGCINHARLSAEAIDRDGCRLAGWVANFLPTGLDSPGATVDLLAESLGQPPMGQIPCKTLKNAPPGTALVLDSLLRP